MTAKVVWLMVDQSRARSSIHRGLARVMRLSPPRIEPRLSPLVLKREGALDVGQDKNTTCIRLNDTGADTSPLMNL